ncbi:MAG: DUF2059 domain-containing protein [Maritimibacter sp.]
MQPKSLISLAFAALIVTASSVFAADREASRAFLEVTGFDVAIRSMQQDAMSGPGIAGTAPDAFGAQWVELARDVFDPDEMVERSLDMMEAILPDDLLAHGATFYASDLGQRLVAAENESQGLSSAERFSAGEVIVEGLRENNPKRLEEYDLMMKAIGGVDSSVNALIEIQVRYLMAAMAAGGEDIDLSEAELREVLQQQAGQLRESMAKYSILGAAYVYRDFSDADVVAYRKALEAEDMQQVYEILNGIQFQVMSERYEAMAGQLGALKPQQDI